MRKTETWRFIFIVAVTLLALYVDLNIVHADWFKSALFWQPEAHRDIALRLGLDLQGGLQVLLAADVPSDRGLDAASMETARRIVESRVNSLGLTEPLVQAQGERRIIVELPGIENPEQAVDTIKGTALLEFADAGRIPLAAGTLVTTTMGGPDLRAYETAGLGAGADEAGLPPIESRVLETIFTGAGIRNVGLDVDDQNAYVVPFELNDDAAQLFATYTASHIGQYLCIVLDKEVISCPVVEGVIAGGQAQIRGDFTYDTARQLAIQLQYGALPVPLRVESFNRIGATLGAESVQKSIRAGVIGLAVVLAFMLVYYRLPGALADIALLIYVLINLALYKTLPVTLTLPGIAGFILSAGMAVDANILIFERMKEEMRRGRRLSSAIETGFTRAWPSIRDAQISTLIICIILFFFGTNFGASVVKGFAITLAIGTAVNLFTAVFATRTLVRGVAVLAGDSLEQRRWLMGV
ncbi:MAG: protein translocase subunit SecD [Chloroflexi bacterium]|nr:protein translocase subunit SecD [Chloroflexota bacterium]